MKTAKTRTRAFAIALVVASPLLWVEETLAHHSGAFFDHQKETTLAGSVKKYAWINPHGFIDLEVKDQGGAPTLWQIELPSPTVMTGFGLTRDTLKAGDQVTLVVYPKRDGTAEGALVTLTLASGKIFTIAYPKVYDNAK